MINVVTLFQNYFKIISKKIAEKIGRTPSYVFCLKNILEKNYPVGTPFSFVQVGANDGVSNDFLYEFVKDRQGSGLVLEPLKEYFRKLKINYGFNKKIHVVNKAVHAEKNEVLLYKVKLEALHVLPDWASGIGSLNAAHHQKSGIPENYITTEVAEADNLMNLIATYQLPKTIDLLQIDVEGYDFEVLKQIQFSRFSPKIVRYEYMNLSKEDLEASVLFMKHHGYYCFYEDIDVICVSLNYVEL